MGLGNLLLACFWRWKIYQVETCSLSGRTSFVRFFFLSSLLTVEITVKKYHAIHLYSKRSIFMEIFSNLFILVVIRSLIALIDAQSFEK